MSPLRLYIVSACQLNTKPNIISQNFVLFSAPIFIYKYIYILIWERQWTEYCEKYAKPEDIGASHEESSDDELSEDDYASSDDGIAGKPDP